MARSIPPTHVRNSLRRAAVSLGCAPRGLLGTRTFLRPPLLLLRPTSPLALLLSLLPFPLMSGLSWRVSCAAVVSPACFPGSRRSCWCGGRSWRSTLHMLLPVRRMGSPDVPASPRRVLVPLRKRVIPRVPGPLSWCGVWNARGRIHSSGVRVLRRLVLPPICGLRP